MSLITIRGLNKSFAGSRILKDISLTIDRGDVVSVIGPSGSGKTTLLRCMNFLERAEQGVLTFDGEEFGLNSICKKDVMHIRKKTGFVFQSYNLFLNKTALQNVTEGLIVARRVSRKAAEETGIAMLRKVGLEDKAHSFPYQLSGGQQQRVAIAMALAARPEIIYFDEPTSALDPELTGEVLSVMRQLAQEGMTMVVVTHEMSFARTISSKVLFMEDGIIVERGTAEQVFGNPQQERTREFLKNISR